MRLVGKGEPPMETVRSFLRWAEDAALRDDLLVAIGYLMDLQTILLHRAVAIKAVDEQVQGG